MNRQIDENLELFYKAVLNLKDEDECCDFFEDICTVTELKSISQRMMVAKMLNEKCVYSDIVKATGASTATVSRVNRSLQYGNSSYKMLLQRIENDK
ncbi:MAG: YerC/YecD family TrpR-related protein [Clostridia bacterium]|nr:YerC/YecD family TrpR-related protein [Clostridia bacterium]